METNNERIIEVYTREWEIAMRYSLELEHQMISLDWTDFRSMVRNHKPLMVIRVQTSDSLATQIKMAYEELQKHTHIKVTGIILSVAYNPKQEISIKELANISFERIIGKDIEFAWGLRTDAQLPHLRQLCVFAFGI